MKSIRASLIVSIVGGLLLLAVVSGIMGFLWARHSLTRQVDSILAAKARALANLVEDDDGEIQFEFSDDNMPEFLSESSHHYFQVWLPDGTVLARSRSLGNHDLPLVRGTLEDPESVAFRLHNRLAGRAVGFQFAPIQEVDDQRHVGPTSAPKATIAVARDTGELEALLIRLLLIIVSFALLLPAASAIIVGVAVRRGLEPLNALAGKVAEINPSSLKTRIAAGEDVVELQPITARLNELLVRLHTAFARERRFTMDASHELRTPLAESRTALEIALKWPEDQKLLVDSAQQALEATYQMEGMVTALLSLARAESDSADGPLENLNLKDTLWNCWNQVNGQANEKGLELSISGGDVASVYSNRTLVTAILANLLGNAAQYSAPASNVECAVSDDPNGNLIRLRIGNVMASPLTQEDLSHLFEPLWRKDKSRTADTVSEDSHFGLGLTLVKAFCQKLEIPVHALIEGDMFVIELQIPGTEETFETA